MGDKKHWCDPGAYGALRVQRSSIYPTIAEGAPTEGAARLGRTPLLSCDGEVVGTCNISLASWTRASAVGAEHISMAPLCSSPQRVLPGWFTEGRPLLGKESRKA